MVWHFSATLFVGSALLFLVQPMIGKMILPTFGGTPAVWNTCMVFFQAMLLAGYAYAHATVTWLGVRRQALVHVVLLLLPLGVLPIVVAANAVPPTEANPIPWLLGQLAVSAGLPFFFVSTTAPLLQRWFTTTNHPHARDPYFLYAASNVGSLLALLGYPLVVEPNSWLTTQSAVWSGGYVVLVVMIVGCALVALRAAPAATIDVSTARSEDGPTAGAPPIGVTNSNRVWWVLLSFVPSSLMLGVTTHLTTDIAAVPLLWVLPLAIYLLTFVLVFARKPPLPLARSSRLLALLVLPLWMCAFLPFGRTHWMLIPVHLLLFFLLAMVCHGRLAESRPAPQHLTEFYLWMSIGGVLGGVFNAIVAPLVFTRVIEYPLIMVVACMLRPGADGAVSRRDRRRDIVLPATLCLVGCGIILGTHHLDWTGGRVVKILVVILPAIACFMFRNRPIRMGLGLAALTVIAGLYIDLRSADAVHRERNFFGVKRIEYDAPNQLRQLVHGVTTHGMQSTDPDRRTEPLGYYHRTGPLGDVFAAFSGSRAKSRVAVIGLGAGTIAAYATAHQHFTFYEIDPAVARLARDPAYFTYLTDSPATSEIVLGDGRLTLARSPDRAYGLLILDAFSSDAIPTHLICREAFALYVAKLDETGVLVFHISNRYLNLTPLIGNLAHDAGLVCFVRADRKVPEAEAKAGKLASVWAVMARTREHVARVAAKPGWKAVRYDPEIPIWTDQYCNVLGAFRWW